MIFLNSCGKDEGTITITPVSIGFLSSTLSIQEDAGAQTVNVVFGDEVPVAASFTVDITGSAAYTTDYTTTPDGSSGSFTVDVAAGESSKSFSFTPVNNENVDDVRTIVFTISGAVDGVELGSDVVLTVTLTDDEIPPVTIASLRADYAANGETTLEEGYVIGVVTSDKLNITGKNVIVQDASAGIIVRFTADNVDFELGDELSIQLAGGSLSDFNGLVQVSGLELTAATELGVGTLPTPVAITIAELLSDDYQSELVTISDVAIKGADGVNTFGSFRAEVFSDVSDNEFNAFVRGGSSLEGKIIPVGVGSVTGVATLNSGMGEVTLRSVDDISVTEIATLGVTAADTDFGAVATTLYSATKVYTLAVATGTLQGDVSVSATANFEVSSDGGTTFGNTAVISMTDAAAGASVSVRFYANTAVDGVINGSISFSSFGVASATIGVMGEETGNGAVTATGTELYISEYAEGSSNNKYLEIYNPTSETIDLTQYAFPNVSNDPTTVGVHEFWNEFPAGATVAPGDVYVIANGSADAIILAEADFNFNFLSNGDDGFALVKGVETDFTVIDWLGDFQGDPGSGWAVAGTADGTKEHTLVRKASISGGNTSWTASAGTTVEDSEWVVKDQDDWTDLGKHTTTADPID